MTRSSVLQWCDHAIYFSLLPVVFFLPISTAVVEVGATICISGFFFKRMILMWWPDNDQPAAKNSLATILPLPQFVILPALAFVFATLLSVVSSQFPYLSWKGFFGKTVEAVVLFFAILEGVKSRQRLNWIISLFVLSSVFVSFDGIWQYFFKQELIFQKAITYEGRITGPFGHPNDFGSYLLVAAVFFVGALTWAWNGRREPSVKPGILFGGIGRLTVIVIGAFMAVAALGWTFSRGAWIGFAGASILLAVFHGKKWYVPVIFLVVFWVVFSSQLGSVRNVSFITDDIALDVRTYEIRLQKEDPQVKKTSIQHSTENTRSILSRFNGTGRYLFWAETFEVFKTAPVFGTGLNSYTDAVQRYNKPWSGYYSHNCYLQMLAEIGIVGLASFLWLMFVLTLESWRAFFKMPNGYYRVVLMSLFSGLVGFWIHGAMDTNFYSTRLGNLMWILMGLVAAVIQLAGKDHDQEKA